jgi:hypothetical protein
VWCGEYGLYVWATPPLDAANWLSTVTRLLEERNIDHAAWSYTRGFGIFDARTFTHDIALTNTRLVTALGLTPPSRSLTLTGLAITGEPRVGSTVSRTYLADPPDATIWTEWHINDARVAEGSGAFKIPATVEAGDQLTVKVQASLRIPAGDGTIKTITQWRHTTVTVQAANTTLTG